MHFRDGEPSRDPSYHRENQFHHYPVKFQLLFGSVAQVSTNFGVLISFQFPVSLYVLQNQVPISLKDRPNSLNCRRL